MNLTKQQIDKDFKSHILPMIKNHYETDGKKDIPARCEEYNNFIDQLQKNGEITENQANKYSIPKNLI
jgi:hypothetical protein